MSASSKGLAVIGLGSTLRRDDGVGVHVLALLQEMIKGKKIAFLNFGTASLGLVNYMKEFKKVLLIDAIDAGLSPAELRIFKFHEVAAVARERKVSSHELSLGDLLGLCDALGVAADVRVAGIQVQDTSYGLEMSGELQAAVTRIAGEIQKFIESWPKNP
jgi:hydrogenase maturation protease